MNAPNGRWGLWLTLVVTNAIKLGGLTVAVDQIFVQASPRALVLALAAFMMAGAQGVEEAVLSFVERFFHLDAPAAPTAPTPAAPAETEEKP